MYHRNCFKIRVLSTNQQYGQTSEETKIRVSSFSQTDRLELLTAFRLISAGKKRRLLNLRNFAYDRAWGIWKGWSCQGLLGLLQVSSCCRWRKSPVGATHHSSAIRWSAAKLEFSHLTLVREDPKKAQILASFCSGFCLRVFYEK